MNPSDPEPVDLSQLRPGPIRHESLLPELLERIKAVYDVIGPYIATSLEHFEISFMRDLNPASEVAIWFRITSTWIAYHEKYLNNEYLPDEDEKALIDLLITISTGVRDFSVLGVPADFGTKLLACYDELGDD